jgi:hypothetical protein
MCQVSILRSLAAITSPPATAMAWQLVADASSDTSQSTVLAIVSTLTSRPQGVKAADIFDASRGSSARLKPLAISSAVPSGPLARVVHRGIRDHDAPAE